MRETVDDIAASGHLNSRNGPADGRDPPLPRILLKGGRRLETESGSLVVPVLAHKIRNARPARAN